jgi:type VI secretion system protein ImpE
MEEAKKLFDAGDLTGAIESVLNFVRANPTNIPARIFLFELSCFSGDWDRANKQLDVIGHQDTNAMIGSMIYRQNFKAEGDRIRYFSDSLQPGILAPPPTYVGDLIQANNRVREGNTAEARALLDKIEEERPAFKALVNGIEVSDFRDYNDLTMCIFEVIFKDQYVWLPMEQVSKVEFFKPKSLRDLYWIQAQVELVEGTNGEMFFPSLYSGSWKHENDQVRLGRMTDWRDLGDDLFIGEGTKLFWMDGKDRSILDIETIEFEHEEN